MVLPPQPHQPAPLQQPIVAQAPVPQTNPQQADDGDVADAQPVTGVAQAAAPTQAGQTLAGQALEGQSLESQSQAGQAGTLADGKKDAASSKKDAGKDFGAAPSAADNKAAVAANLKPVMPADAAAAQSAKAANAQTGDVQTGNAQIGDLKSVAKDVAQKPDDAGRIAQADPRPQPASVDAPAPQPQPAQPVNATATASLIAAGAAPAHQGPVAASVTTLAAAPMPQHLDVRQEALTPNMAALGVAIATRNLSGARQFDIRLDPPELGRVEVRLSIDSTAKASAHLSADQQHTLDLLQQDSSGLTRALRDAGLDVAQNGLNFSLRQQGGGNENRGFSARGRTGSQSLAATAVMTATTTSAALSGASAYAGGDGRLDIRV